MVTRLYALNLQQSLAASPRIRLELVTLLKLYMEMSGSSFGTFFLIGPRVCQLA